MAGTITVSLHATLHSVSQIKNEIADNQFKNNNNNRINCEDRNIQQQTFVNNLPVKSVGKNLEHVLTVAQPTSTTTNTAAVDGDTNAAKIKDHATKSSSKKRARNDGMSTPELLRCKRRINFTQLGYNIPQAAPTSVARRNERERNRVKLVNLGFATLREHVPNGSKNKKMSKVDTLRSAVEYIRKLQQLLDDEEDDDDDDEENAGGESNVGGGSSSTGDDVGSPYTDSNVDSLAAAENLPPTTTHHAALHAANYSSSAARSHQCPPPSLSPNCSVSSSPSPSHASDYSSYEPLSPEEEDLLDFTSWFT